LGDHSGLLAVFFGTCMGLFYLEHILPFFCRSTDDSLW